MTQRIIIGTRGSELALWQAEYVQRVIRENHPGLEVALEIIKTKGDKILDQALSKIGDKGLFTREIENALLDGRVDIAVHSLKDLPTETPDGLCIAAITEREMVNDVLISKHGHSLEQLPDEAVIATGSLRRRAQLLHLRPDLRIVDIRGNLNTRLEKFDASDCHAMVLAYAGIARLGLGHRISHVIPTTYILPAVGQGALGVEIRVDDRRVEDIVACLHHSESAAAASAERAMLRELEGGCQVPIGAYARIEKGRLLLDAMVASVDASLRLDTRGSAGDPAKSESLGKRVAKKLLDNGAREILDEIRRGGL